MTRKISSRIPADPSLGRTSPYLEDIPRSEAERRLREALIEAELWRPLDSEAVPLDEHAAGRVTAAPVWARISSPNYHAAAMDGFAVFSESTYPASPQVPVELVIGRNLSAAGDPQCLYVDTGDALPEWADAVVPVENVEALDARGKMADDIRHPDVIRIRAAVAPWSHVRPMGEDIVATQLVLPSGRVLRPVDLGAVAAAGHDSIQVVRRPRVAIIPTGSELLPLGSTPPPGGILEYNSVVLAAMIRDMGGTATRSEIIKDDPALISEAVRRAAQDHELILLNAGSSAGAEDFSEAVIRTLGSVLVHGVAVRPGHPVIMGILDPDPARGTPARPVIGVPGYPVSAALTLDIFVEPLLATWLGRAARQRHSEVAELTRKITSPSGDEDHVRVAVGKVGGRLLAAPLASGAGVITSLVQADGIVVIPRGVQGIESGEPVEVTLYRTRAELDETIFCIGSHDVTLDLLAQLLSNSGRRLVSANVGSQGGLIALGRGQAHVAGCHLLDPDTGIYNVPAIRRYLPGVRVRVIRLAAREQGLMVRRGNPKQIGSLADLARPGMVFVNRQRGAGTRMLLDYHLRKLGLSADAIEGYGREEFTHLAVAVSVAGGRADCGLGIAAAASALGLDFVPLYSEQYDIVVPCEYAESDLLAPLLELLQPGPFQEEVAKLPGYDISLMGTVVLDDGKPTNAGAVDDAQSGG